MTDIGEPLTIGASQESSDNGQANNLVKFFDGNISEVTVYDSQLSVGQIGDLIDAGDNGSDTAPDATLYGASFGDTITGDAAANTISGLGGDDLLDGSVGADLIYGVPSSSTSRATATITIFIRVVVPSMRTNGTTCLSVGAPMA